MKKPDGIATITRRGMMRMIWAAGGMVLVGCGSLPFGTGRSRASLPALRNRIAGRVALREDPGFEQTRASMLWNGLKPKRSPDLIVHAASIDDVRETVRFARENHLKCSVRGGGHHWSGTALREGGVLIDLGALNEVTVDAESKTATVQPGVRNQELLTRLGAQDLAFPSGHCPTVTVSGHLLGGGFGWNSGE